MKKKKNYSDLLNQFPHMGALIKDRRESKKISQKSLAISIGFQNGQAISNVERGLNSIPMKKAIETATILGISIETMRAAYIADFCEQMNEYLPQTVRAEN